ncbi:soma ferritin-like isoform X2 [Eriocheir sinensis]|uniref:soma ferritin-like isoform X2 n=1 Tax=Eriocheir sinensis TaxID=95602 RepID=UPI0021CA2EBC|nr:soma ferritin-like isoform X2 [Eriocheir sinensis]
MRTMPPPAASLHRLLLLLLATLCLLPCLTHARNDAHRHRQADMPTVGEEEEMGHGGGSGGDNGGGHYGGYGGEGEVQPMARCRHNYHERTEAAINRQINLFHHVGYVYSSMAHHFSGCDVALPGFEKFFQQMAEEQQVRAATLTKYQSLRGGVAMMLPVSAPATNNWGSGLEAMERALELEKSVNQVEKIFTLSQYVTSLERVGPGLGEYMFDKMPQN